MRVKEHITRHGGEILFLGAFLVGVGFINLSGFFGDAQIDLMNLYYIQKVPNLSLAKEELFCYLLKCRILLFGGLFAGSMTRARKVVHLLFLLYAGLGMGICAAAFVISFRLPGAVLFFFGMFPQLLLYVLSYYILVKLTKMMGEEMITGVTTREKLFMLSVGIILFIVIFAGICLESFLSPVILQKIVTVL